METKTAICLVRLGNGSDFHLPFCFLLILGKKSSPWSGNGGASSPGPAPRREPQARAQVCSHRASSPEVGPVAGTLEAWTRWLQLGSGDGALVSDWPSALFTDLGSGTDMHGAVRRRGCQRAPRGAPQTPAQMG